MGKKITIDSATLMNKGLEVLRLTGCFPWTMTGFMWLFTPRALSTRLSRWLTGFCTAQLGPADMRLPIQFALTYPERRENPFSRLDLVTPWAAGFFPAGPGAFSLPGPGLCGRAAGQDNAGGDERRQRKAVTAFLEGGLVFPPSPPWWKGYGNP